ncbi:exosortase [Sulfitobacter sp. SK012]|uniref:polysaccharide pyruvyl transferase family protein n=1 Tax=Sulfitobacter sp. SK012 TaxID=1389005 RepID=UPI000E0C56C7|nr:polysaccharide pyruvyl transferase family protein [Sulfitobacter sp. SK012]AXI46599.1 exosortase [Sulfitobacter sp. SK012]
MADTAPLRLHWWKAVPNFGDAINPLIVSHMSGRAVKHAGPKRAELFAIGSLLQVVRRAFVEPREGARLSVWGTGLLHAVNSRGFLDHIDIALVRGPITAALLGLEHTQFGDAGLLIDQALPFDGTRTDRIGIVPHHTLVDDPELLAFVASDPAYALIDPQGDAASVCQQIAGCAHVFASSLHGLIVADAYGVANTWITPKGQSRLKYHDYAASVGRSDMAAPMGLPDVPKAPKSSAITYADGIARCRAALCASFPSHLRAA